MLDSQFRFVLGLTGLLLLCLDHSASADDSASKPEDRPRGIYTRDDGQTIVVGIGTTKPLATLDVSRGDVKVGSTGAPCTTKLAGTIRYANSRLQLCDGAGWRNVSLDKAE